VSHQLSNLLSSAQYTSFSILRRALTTPVYRLTRNDCSLVRRELQAFTWRCVRRSSKWCAGWKWVGDYQGMSSASRRSLFSSSVTSGCLYSTGNSPSLKRHKSRYQWSEHIRSRLDVRPTWVFCQKATTSQASSESASGSRQSSVDGGVMSVNI